LQESRLVHEHDGAFSLQNTVEFWRDWQKKQKLRHAFFKKVRRTQAWLALCPFIKLIAVCNTLPLGDVREDSDIDLFVVTQKNRLFIARLGLTVLTSLLGVRRHGRKIRKRFCLSFYVTEEHLNLEGLALKPLDLYLAYWVKTLEPITGDFHTYETFLRENAWIKALFATIQPKKRYFRKSSFLQQFVRGTMEKLLNHDLWERKAQNHQLRRIREKAAQLSDASGTVISETMLKFHDHDARSTVLQNWTHSLEKLL